MGAGLKLKVPLIGICAVVFLEGTLDIHGVCVVPLNEVALIADHGAYQGGERIVHTGW